MALPTVVVAAIRLVSGLADSTRTTLLLIGLLLWDLALTIYNLLAPLHPAERVVREGLPGADGLWPEYIPPGKTDSRSCCPVINALANHGAPQIPPPHCMTDGDAQGSCRVMGGTSRSRS